MDTVYIVMPAYNEEANIEDVIKSWYKILDDKNNQSKLVIADSGSTDSTHDILCRLKKEMPKIEIISDTDRQHGPKLMSLYSYAIESGADYIFQTDSDGQTTPSEFHEFWNLRKQYAGIIGERYSRGDGIFRIFIEKIVCLLLYFYFGVKVPDANAPFRLINSEVLKKYLYRMPNDYNIPNIMVTAYLTYYKENIKFVKISFKARQGGKNSLNVVKIVKIGVRALKDFSIFKKSM